jgi:hypothetical protein
MDNKGNLISKDIFVEEKSLRKIKIMILANRTNFESKDEIIGDLLKKYARGEMKLGEDFEEVDRRKVRVLFDKEALDSYNSIKTGGKSFVINSLLRT